MLVDTDASVNPPSLTGGAWANITSSARSPLTDIRAITGHATRSTPRAALHRGEHHRCLAGCRERRAQRPGGRGSAAPSTAPPTGADVRGTPGAGRPAAKRRVGPRPPGSPLRGLYNAGVMYTPASAAAPAGTARGARHQAPRTNAGEYARVRAPGSLPPSALRAVGGHSQGGTPVWYPDRT